MYRIVYDLEATCWEGQPYADKQEIIELAAIMLDDFGESVDEFQSFVSPVLAPYLSPYCKQLTGITQEQVDSAPSFKVVLQSFIDWLPEKGEELLFVNWGKYDPVYIQADCRQHGIDADWLQPTLDLKRSYQRYKGLHTAIGLQSALKAEGIDSEGDVHRAYWDAFNLTKLYKKNLGHWPRV